MSDLSEQKKLLLRRLRAEMSAALVNNSHVRLCIENIDFMNLVHLLTSKDIVIDLESVVNTVLNKEINDEAHLEIPAAQLKSSCTNKEQLHKLQNQQSLRRDTDYR